MTNPSYDKMANVPENFFYVFNRFEKDYFLKINSIQTSPKVFIRLANETLLFPRRHLFFRFRNSFRVYDPP